MAGRLTASDPAATWRRIPVTARAANEQKVGTKFSREQEM